MFVDLIVILFLELAYVGTGILIGMQLSESLQRKANTAADTKDEESEA